MTGTSLDITGGDLMMGVCAAFDSSAVRVVPAVLVSPTLFSVMKKHACSRRPAHGIAGGLLIGASRRFTVARRGLDRAARHAVGECDSHDGDSARRLPHITGWRRRPT